MMKKTFLILLSIITLGAFQSMNAQNCDALELQYYKFLKQKDYTQAYPIWQQAFQQCPDKKVNVFNHGEEILVGLIEASTAETDKSKYATELVNMIDKRIATVANGTKAFWEGEKIAYQLKYGLIDKMGVYNAYKTLFSSSEDTQKVSANAVLTYYSTSLELMNAGSLDFEQILEVYYQTKLVAEDNIELRSMEFGVLAEKKDSLSKMTPAKKLSAQDEERMANAQSAKDVYVDVYESMESVLKDYTTCENVAPMFTNKFEANKDSIEWVTSAYQSLASSECYDQPIMATLEAQYQKLWKEQNPGQPVASTGGGSSAAPVSSCFGEGARLYKAGNYSAAIDKFNCALNEVSGSQKGDVAYYIALCYEKTGSNSNAISWAKKAANFKPGWGAPYQLISGIFGSSANSCGSSRFEKLTAYWVAADYANKAAAVDSRSRSWANKAVASYNANGPSQEDIFNSGKKKGDRVSISCLGGATTTVR